MAAAPAEGGAGAAGAAVDCSKYFFVGYIEAHGLTPTGDAGVQTRQKGPQYQDITVRELSIPGDQYVSGMMGSIENPPEDMRHWWRKSNTSVTSGILRKVFKDHCDDPDEIPEAFEEATRQLKTVYAAANIEFPDGGFTVRENSPDYQWLQLRRNPRENSRRSQRGQYKREASDYYLDMPPEGYGIFCVCTNHPYLRNFCLSAIKDNEVERETYYGTVTQDFIPSRFYPGINMIGHDNGNPPGPLGAHSWMQAIRVSGTDADLQELAIRIIEKAYLDKNIHSQDFITVLRALNIGDAWLFNPACRDLCKEIVSRKCGDPLSPPHHLFPDSQFTPPSSPSPSPPRPRSRSRTPSPPPPPPLESPPPGRWSGFMNWFKGRRQGGSRKSRKGTTPTRRKITRKTKKGAYKRKSQKRNRRK